MAIAILLAVVAVFAFREAQAEADARATQQVIAESASILANEEQAAAEMNKGQPFVPRSQSLPGLPHLAVSLHAPSHLACEVPDFAQSGRPTSNCR